MWLAILESIKGFFFVFKFWNKKKEKKRDEKIYDARRTSDDYEHEFDV